MNGRRIARGDFRKRLEIMLDEAAIRIFKFGMFWQFFEQLVAKEMLLLCLVDLRFIHNTIVVIWIKAHQLTPGDAIVSLLTPQQSKCSSNYAKHT